jgi:Domain of unknown function (DUF4410)
MPTLAKSFSRVALFASCWLILVTIAGCASMKVTEHQAYEGPKRPRPDRIIVHDFAATPADLPPWSDAAKRHAEPSTPRSEQEIEVGRQLGSQVAKELVQEIQDMGLPAVRAAGQPAPRVNDVVLVGYFSSIDEGSAVERVTIGFGKGAAKLTTVVEGYVMTEQGLRKAGSGTVASDAGKTPGVVVPAAVMVATANPIGLIVGGAAKAEGEVSGRTTIEGVATETANKIADTMRVTFQQLGWI